MVNLIKKDIITSIKSEGKNNIKYLLVFILFYFMSKQSSYYTSSVFISYLILANTFYYDYENNSRNFINSMPINKEDIVYSKYLIAMGTILITIILTSIIYKIGATSFYRGPVLNDVIISFNIFLMISSIILPLYFKFGYHKVRMLAGIIGVIIYSLCSGILHIVATRVYQVNYSQLHDYGFVNSFVGSGPFTKIMSYMANDMNIKYFNLYTITFITLIIFILSMYVSIKIIKSSKNNY